MRVSVAYKRAGGPFGPPAVTSFSLLAGAFARGLRLLHPFRHLGFHGIQVETRAALHRRVIEECLKFLAHHLLDEYESPELKLEPIEVLLSAVFRPVVGPALALERIKSQVGDVGHV